MSTLFTNDATVLILTPILYEMLRALGFDNRMMLPYMMASGFVADAAHPPAEGLQITWPTYVRASLVITPPVLLAALAALWASLALLG